MVDGIPDGIMAFDRTGRCLYANAAAAALVDGEPGAMVGRLVAEVLPAALAARLAEVLRAGDRGGPRRLETTMPPDRWLEHLICPVADGVTVVSRDVTERWHAAAARRAGEAKYHALFEAMDQGVLFADVIFDDAGHAVDIYYREANPAAIQMVNADFSGQRLREVLPEAERYWYELPGQVARTGQPLRVELYAHALRQWFDVNIVPAGGAPHRVAIIFQEITAEKRAEARRGGEPDG
jgi:PAS domain-containing protein